MFDEQSSCGQALMNGGRAGWLGTIVSIGINRQTVHGLQTQTETLLKRAH